MIDVLESRGRNCSRAGREDALARYSHSEMRMPCWRDRDPLLLDPLSGHPESERHITNLKSARNHQGILAAGRGFVVRGDGIGTAAIGEGYLFDS
jgi:hypothetical protein